VSEAERQTIIRRYVAGESSVAIAGSLGRVEQTVQRVIREAGVTRSQEAKYMPTLVEIARGRAHFKSLRMAQLESRPWASLAEGGKVSDDDR
jgi:IS30 family transposase